MKKILGIVFVAASIFLASQLRAQSIDGVVSGIKASNVIQITENAGDAFSLTLLDKSSNYNKADAQKALKDFFAKNVVKGFEIKHKGSSPNGQYAIGTLNTGNGNYRVNIFMKKEEDGKELIKELRFQLLE